MIRFPDEQPPVDEHLHSHGVGASLAHGPDPQTPGAYARIRLQHDPFGARVGQ